MRIVFAAAVVSLLAGCSKKDEPGPTPPKPEPPAETKAPPPPSAPQVIRLTGFSTPESVLWDDQAGMYLVSNINGSPVDKDDNGFIARVSPPPDAKLVDAAWIDGRRDDVTLHAPKGMALVGDTLYVADVDTVRMFDRKTGAPKGEIAIPGAVFLNDLAAGDGVVYASDSGLDASFTPGPAQAVWELRDGKPTKLAGGEELGAPNGLVVHDGALWVVTFGSGELYRLVDGKREAIEKLPKGALDGVQVARDGRWFVSSWEGQTIFVGTPGSWQSGPSIKSPADFELDDDRALLVVPVFEEGRVEMHELPRVAP